MGGWVLEWRVRLGSGRKGEKEGREEKRRVNQNVGLFGLWEYCRG